MLPKVYLNILVGIVFIFSSNSLSDSFIANSFNNHGSVGIINLPTARFYDEGSYGISAYKGKPDSKLTFTSFPYDWLEASLFYTSVEGLPYDFKGDYKDKGFSLKIRIKEEDRFPAIAIGFNDIAGTGLYSSEYFVASYGIGNLDMHLGLGWGQLNGTADFKNPFSYISDSFKTRPEMEYSQGGDIQFNRYFSDENISPFFGLSYFLNDKFILKIERDTTLTPGPLNFEEAKEAASFGIDYSPTKNLTFGLSAERGNNISFKFIYKKDDNKISSYKFKEGKKGNNKYQNFIRNLRENGIGVNKVIKKGDKLGIETTQFSNQGLQLIKQIIEDSKVNSGIEEEILINYKTVDLDVIKDFDRSFEDGSIPIYQRDKRRSFNSNNKISIRPFLASREGFFKGAILFENDIEYLLKDNFIFSSNIKYSIYDNFDDLYIPPETTYPAQVRSDIKDYLKNFDEGVIGRAQIDYFSTIKSNHHIQLSGGIFEEMFLGYGLEYLWFDPSKNYSIGFELFDVKKRDYDLRFGTLDYRNTTGHINLYYRNFHIIPFDLKTSYGEYLAGDKGITFEISRTFLSGIKFGAFASFTDVSRDDFGEGSFDKGIFFTIPIFRENINYSWRPLTKDPAQKLIRKNNLHDLLVKFRPIN